MDWLKIFLVPSYRFAKGSNPRLPKQDMILTWSRALLDSDARDRRSMPKLADYH